MPGTLFVVATPIGNLEDMTYRAVRILNEVDLIACEDTRQTRKLLDRYGIRKPMLSYHEHNERTRAEELIERLRQGANVALLSDAGTPLVSDPGYRLVSRAVEESIPIDPIPGPSAVVAALVASGMPAGAFHFGGFLPARSAQRRKALENLKDEEATVIFYEAPHRILQTLRDIDSVLGPRPVVIAREMTKIHQEFLRGTPQELLRSLSGKPSIKGEMTLLIRKPSAQPTGELPVREAVQAAMRAGISRQEAMKSVARRHGLSKREVYRALLEE